MKKIYLTIALVLAVLLAASLRLLIREKTAMPQFSEAGNSVEEIMINGQSFSTEVVDTPEKRALGLSGRRGLCPQCAMLFIFEKPGIFSFWMKDMQFDLDIIWIAGDEIEGVSKNVSHAQGSAEAVRPDTAIDKVVEINAGVSDRLNLRAGDKVEF